MALMRSLHRCSGLAEPSSSFAPRHPVRECRRSDIVKARSTNPNQSGDVELWELHEELLKEIEQRKRKQEEILRKFKQLSYTDSKPTSQSSTAFKQPTYKEPVMPADYKPTAHTYKQPAFLDPPKPAAPPAPAQPYRQPTPYPTPAAPTPPPQTPTRTPQSFRETTYAPPQTPYAPPQSPTPAPARPPQTFRETPLYTPPSPQTTMPPMRSPQNFREPATMQDYFPNLPTTQMQPDSAAPATPAEDPIPENVNAMKVVFVGAEVAPWSKTGGLGDVMGALPKAMTRRGHRVMVVAPRYDNYDDAWETGVRKTYSVMGWPVEVGYFHAYKDGVDYVFVDHPCYHNRGQDIYGGDRGEIQFRCALLCKAALEAVWHVPCGGITYGDDNCVFVANDWHTALLPVYLQAHYRDYGQMTFARSVFVIHNIAHQGRAPFVESERLELNEHYTEQLRLYDPVGGEHMNIMKAGVQNAHRIIAVSTGYAWECQTQDGGWGLDGVLKENGWKLKGIVNGIDYQEWSPQFDSFLKSDGYINYTINTLAQGKAQCKAALQRELGLPVDPSIPLLGFIGRLDYQKGVDLIRDIYDWLMNEKVQLVLLGSGREDLENALRDMEGRNRHQCRGWVGFSVKMAHRITAGCDILLMPSRFEPCGLNQLYAMAYGTVPVVHAVGGLRDTVQQFNPFENTGTGWTFDRAEAHKLQEAVGNALVTYRQHKKSYVEIMQRGMEQDLSWDNAAQQYEDVLVAAKYQW